LGFSDEIIKEPLLKTKLYVSNLSSDMNEAELDRHFSAAGKVVSVAIVRGRYSRQSRGLALVEMETEAGTERAIRRFRGASLDGSVIDVSSNRGDWAWNG
jgi:RNA recognition motif-containing protein